MFSLAGKVAIVTGASRGIGGAIAVGLAQTGAQILTVSRSEPDSTVQKGLAETGLTHAHHAADLSQVSNVPGVIEAALEKFGRVDILVNNAGIIRRAPLLEYSEADWDAVLDTNLKIPFFLAQAMARQLVAQKQGGKIINICSLLSFQGGILVPAYTAAKHGLAGITKAMANELAPHGINVNAIAPGYIRTDNTAALQADENRNTAILARIPTGRWGETEDIVGAAVYLASSAANYLQGHLLCVDGGWLAR